MGKATPTWPPQKSALTVHRLSLLQQYWLAKYGVIWHLAKSLKCLENDVKECIDSIWKNTKTIFYQDK